MEEEKETQTKWEGEISREFKESKIEEIWSKLADFCNIHKWYPIDICYKVEGISGEPGLVRYCAVTKTNIWAKERLLLIDPVNHVLSYEVLENNVGLKSYVATVKVSPITGDDDNSGCKIVWSFVCEPIEGWTVEDLKHLIDSYLHHMSEKLDFLHKSEGNRGGA